jgi:hypothetical protein
MVESMKFEEKLEELEVSHESLLVKIAEAEKNPLPRQVDKKKLEKAYELMKGYALAFRKKGT